MQTSLSIGYLILNQAECQAKLETQFVAHNTSNSAVWTDIQEYDGYGTRRIDILYFQLATLRNSLLQIFSSRSVQGNSFEIEGRPPDLHKEHNFWATYACFARLYRQRGFVSELS